MFLIKKLIDFGHLQQLIDDYNVNIIHFIFAFFILTIVFFGILINIAEPYLPNWVRQSFRYGKHKHTGPRDPLISLLEIPKSWFRHFYNFAMAWSMLALYLLVGTIRNKRTAPEYVLRFLDFFGGGTSRSVQLDTSTALVALVFMTLQCARRFYETNYVQIFSTNSKMNLSHYIVGYAHYFGAIIALLANTEGFVRNTKPSALRLDQFNGVQVVSIVCFSIAWCQQHFSNMVFVNMRKDLQTGQVKTEQHLMPPESGFFRYITSPHMFFEIVIYCSLNIFMGAPVTWLLICSWVFSNQIANALLTHQWYKKKFENYPKHRRAIIPFVL